MCGLDYLFSLVRSPVQAMEEEEEEEEEEGDGADPLPSCDSKQGFGSAVPDVLHKVLLANGSRVAKPEGYLLLALHAVMLETGLMCVDSWGVAGRSEFLTFGWNEKAEPLVLRYTLSELLEPSTAVEGASDHILEEITLTCKKSGDEFCAYGTVTGGEGSEEYSIRLPISQYVCDQSKAMRNNSKLRIQSDANSIYSDPYGLWKEVKDGLSLPLLTVLCKRAGLQPPSSFLTLPTELKIKVLERLPARSLARVCCVCSELRFLGASDDLWKKRYIVESGLEEWQNRCASGWKAAFAEDRIQRISEREETFRSQWTEKCRSASSAARLPMPPRGSLTLQIFGLKAG